jgi:hypothetical protein
MLDWLKNLFGGAPQPAGPSRTIRKFGTGDATLSRDQIKVAQDGWLIDSTSGGVIRLFELPDPQVEQCVVTYRAQIKSEGLSGRAYLEMWCRLPGSGEFFSKGLQQPVSGTTEWASYEIPFYLKKGQQPDLIKLNLVIEGRGKVWMRDVELLATPLQ